VGVQVEIHEKFDRADGKLMKKHYKYKKRELPANIIHECSYSAKKLKDFCA